MRHGNMGHSQIWLTVVVVALALPLGPAMAATLIVDDNNDPESCGGDDSDYATITAAAADALSGDRILVCPGTYIEQVTLGASPRGLTLESRGPGAAVIQAPPRMVGPKAIVRANGARDVIIESFTIRGPGGGGCDSIRSGVRVDAGGSATIRNNRITAIRDDPLSGCQNGVGILVGGVSEAMWGTASIQNNIIEGYQKGGIVVSSVGARATITENLIMGEGPTSLIAQNGVEFNSGATGRLSGNVIADNFYLSSPSADRATLGNLPVAGCIPVATAVTLFHVDPRRFLTLLLTRDVNDVNRNQAQVFFLNNPLALAHGRGQASALACRTPSHCLPSLVTCASPFTPYEPARRIPASASAWAGCTSTTRSGTRCRSSTRGPGSRRRRASLARHGYPA